MQAAIDGLGVVLGRVVLAEDDLAARRLVRPFALALPMELFPRLVEGRSTPRPEILSFQTGCSARCGRTTTTCHRPNTCPSDWENALCRASMTEAVCAARSALGRRRSRCVSPSVTAHSASD